MAAYGVIANLALVAMSMFNGVAQGSQPLISRYYGQGDEPSARRILQCGIWTALGIAAVIIVVTRIETNTLIAMFNSEGSEGLRSLAFDGVRLYFPGFLFAGINIVATGYLSASDCGIQALAASFSRGVVAIVLCAFTMSRIWGMKGVWSSFMAAELLTCIMVVVMMAHLGKRRK